MNVPVLMNARAGLAHPAGELRLARTLARHQLKAVIEEVPPADLADRLRELTGRPLVGVAGGDGTHRTAARALAGSSTVLVPFPTGRLNHFARRLGLDSVDRAAQAVKEGSVRGLPVGRANDSVFVNTAVVGLYPRLIRVRERLRPYLTTWPAAALAALHGFVTWPRVRLTIRSPGAARDCNTALIWVGVGTGSFPAPHEAPLPGHGDALEVVFLADRGRLDACTVLAASVRRRVRSSKPLQGSVTTQRLPWLKLDADEPVPMALDGEPKLVEPPVLLRFEPAALRVVTAREW